MKRHILYIFLIFSVFACLLPTMALAASEDTDEEVTEISNKADLIALLNDTGTRSGTYRLTDDFTIDTNELRGAEGDYSFKATSMATGTPSLFRLLLRPRKDLPRCLILCEALVHPAKFGKGVPFWPC